MCARVSDEYNIARFAVPTVRLIIRPFPDPWCRRLGSSGRERPRRRQDDRRGGPAPAPGPSFAPVAPGLSAEAARYRRERDAFAARLRARDKVTWEGRIEWCGLVSITGGLQALLDCLPCLMGLRRTPCLVV